MRHIAWLSTVLALALPGPAELRADRPLTAAELAREIDRHIAARLREAKLDPAPPADDADFLRRVWLDVAGVVPPADRAAAFLADRRPDRRARLVDELLAGPRYAQRRADVWLALLVERDSANEPVGFQPLRDWLVERFARNQPWGEMVRDLLSASGTQPDSAATTFYLASPAPEQLVDRISQVFLGVQLKCAQCHDHPFTGWKRDDYWAMAGYFTELRFQGLRPTIGMTSVRDAGAGTPYVRPESYLKRPPRVPGDGEQPALDGPPRQAFVQWLVAPTNPFFARATVNRIWAQLLGRGLVEPVDDMNEEASHPELLNLLTAQFVAGGHDLRHLIRAICLSEAYQRTATGSEQADLRLYQRAAVRALSPEQLYDSLTALLGEQTRGVPGRGRFPGRTAREVFLDQFRVEGPSDPTEYRGGIPQALRLMNATPLTSRNVDLLRQVTALPAAEGVERLFLTALSRPPTEREKARFTAAVTANREEGYSAALWALINCSEFALTR